MLKNTEQGYGLVARVLHWLLALLLTGLFALGWYMTELDYYHPWYHAAPEWHRSVGVVTFLLILVRLGWTLANPKPRLPASMRPWQRVAATGGHHLLYLLMILVPLSGYLISTADGHALDVLGLFEIPALFGPVQGMEAMAGWVHYLLAFGAAWLVLVHALAALKHQFIDRDRTLTRMIRGQ
ncbi:MAG TPA: cytochrome b [Candidatus Competibacteraceae bacterium]|nr:cytochrome b [Candidatus Competibacteraceae bacterium]